MTTLSDTFDRANGALGTSSSGHAWSVLTGTISIASNRALANNGSRAIAVLEANNDEGTVQVDIGTGGGYCLYFRVIDSVNWWRLGVNKYSYTYPSGTEDYIDHYDQVPTGTEEYNDYDINSITAHYSGANGTVNTVEVFTAIAPNYPSVPSNYWYGDTYMAYIYADPMITTDHYAIRPVYTSVAVWATRTVYSTTYLYTLSLEKCISGTITQISNVGISQSSWLRVTMSGNNIQTFCSSTGNTPQHSVSDSTHATGTKHGLGYYESTVYGNTDGLDNFYVSTDNNPPLTPGIPTVVPNPVYAAGIISWGASTDPDSDPVTYTIQLSTDNGVTWSGNLIPYTSATSVVYDFLSVASSTTVKVRVVALDSNGASSAWAVSNTFTVAHNAVAKIWSGSAFVTKPIYRWTGSQWRVVIIGSLARWNGSSWVNTS